MEKKTKSILMIAAVIILSVMFVLGNVAGSNSSPPTKGTTTTITPTLLVTGTANAVIQGYSRNMVLYGQPSNSLLNELGILQKEGNINSYTKVGNQIDVNGSNFSSYLVYNSIVGYSTGLAFNTTAYIKLPNPVMLRYSGSLVRIDIGNSTYPLRISNILDVGSTVPVSVQAIVTEQGTLYQNQLRLAELG